MAEPYTGDSTLEHACIEITTSEVTLDCKSHSLTGSGEKGNETAGIYIAGSGEPLTDIEVEGCVISAHQIGLYAGLLAGTNTISFNLGNWN
jgi:hypothetical protein